VPQELGRLTVSHHKTLLNALLFRSTQPAQQFGPQRGVGVLLPQRGEYVLHFCGVTVVQLRDRMIEFCPVIADAWTKQTAGCSAQNGGRRTATLDTSSGGLCRFDSTGDLTWRKHISTKQKQLGIALTKTNASQNFP
jgi:hypothetical protein